MRSDSGAPRAGWGLRLAAGGGLLFLNLPLLFILVYALTTDDRSFTFPPPGLTLRWFAVAWERPDVWRALLLSVEVALVATALALALGTLAPAALFRFRFFVKEPITLLILLPIALPGSITGINLRPAFPIAGMHLRLWSIL